jgi:predicted flap endonuclease-1-like 5' DNA nuclease
MEEDKTPDDLRVIEGIGPKISAILLEAGIRTYTQLAATEVERLQSILEEAGIRIANPSTWPEQAKLAAAGKWEALESLQDELKGGRRAG